MAEFKRGTPLRQAQGGPPPIPPPPQGGQLQPGSPLSPGPVIGWMQGADGNPDPLNIMDRPVPIQTPGRGGRQPTLSGAENALNKPRRDRP